MARSCGIESGLESVSHMERTRGLVPQGLGCRCGQLHAARLSALRSVKRAGRLLATCQALSSGNGCTEIIQLIDGLDSGEVTPADAAQALTALFPEAFKNNETQRLALDESKQGVDLVWGLGKTPHEIAARMLDLAEHQRSVLATRIEPEVYAAVRNLVPGVKYHAGAKILTMHVPKDKPRWEQPRLPGSVAILTSDSADLAVAEECRLVAEHLGCYTFKLAAMSATDLAKVLDNMQALEAASVVVVVAGMDGALPSVVAGLIDAPVVVVPTSVDHGAPLGGISALMSSLSSSSSGITVVNVDNGIAAAFAAARTLKTADRIIDGRSKQAKALVVSDGGRIGVAGNGRSVSIGEGDAVGLESPSGNGNGAGGGDEVEDAIMEVKMLTRKIGKPLLGLLIFQTGALLPKLVPLGIGATAVLT